MEKVRREDEFTAGLMVERIERSLATLRSFPMTGTPIEGMRSRSYAVPNSGHSFNYRVMKSKIQITRWYRDRQNVAR